MACSGKSHPEIFFKKGKTRYVSKDTSFLENSTEEGIFWADYSEKELADDDVSDSLLGLELFNNEDTIIAKLFREVVDEIMTINNLEESEVLDAISEIKKKILSGHKRGFNRFSGIDFCAPEYQCGYLRRYAICNTGLVKLALSHFFNAENFLCKKARDIILNLDICKVVSLGGGPGNDMIAFCSALEEISSGIEEFDLKIVDISQGWMSVFPLMLKKAYRANFGSLSEFLKKVKVNTGFLQRNLREDKIFDDTTLSTIIGEVDVVLMVKLVSFISEQEAVELIQNVVNCMKEGAYLIFIDSPFTERYFDQVQELDFIYKRKYIKYKLAFKPSKYHSPSVSEVQGNVCVFSKEFQSLSHGRECYKYLKKTELKKKITVKK